MHDIAVRMPELAFLRLRQDIVLPIRRLKLGKTDPDNRMILKHVDGTRPKEQSLAVALRLHIANRGETR